jgi:hypothetical protein
MVHSRATDTDDPTEMPRWGKIGKQKIEDAGTLYPKRMETVDDEILDFSLKFMDKECCADGQVRLSRDRNIVDPRKLFLSCCSPVRCL